MAQLLVFRGNRPPEAVPLYRTSTTVGADRTCTVTIEGAGLRDVHAEIVQEGRLHYIAPLDRKADVLVNGRKTKRARLETWDVIRMGRATVVYAPDDAPLAESAVDMKQVVAQLENLYQFSTRLMDSKDLDTALQAILDQTLELTSATKGFIIFVENGEPRVRVARNIRKKDLPTDDTLFSETIVKKALSDGQPQLVTDAVHNKEFSGCTSVISLKLTSVMCVPLKVHAETIGCLYLGTDRPDTLFDVLRLKAVTVYAAQAAVIIQHLQFLASLEEANVQLKEDLRASRFGRLIGACPGMRDVFARVERVAATDLPVLVLGETGTGKELIAREIHQRSHRAHGPFVAINCGAIPENLLESELFGHVRGAFTGAVTTTIGKFHAASSGTLFLDEIGELPLQLQVKLLRVLEDGVVYRVGSPKGEKVDVRLVAATNKDLRREVKDGQFREDLYFRIAVVTIDLPPLRKRGEDIELLAMYFLKKFSSESGSPARSFTPEALEAIKGYSWPGNIRELENRIRRAVLFADGPHVRIENLDIPKEVEEEVLPLSVAREQFEREYVLTVLRKNKGNRAKTARDLGVDPRTVFRYLEKERESGRGLDI